MAWVVTGCYRQVTDAVTGQAETRYLLHAFDLTPNSPSNISPTRIRLDLSVQEQRLDFVDGMVGVD